MFALIFLNSAITLKLRGYQRRQNLNLLQSKLKNESNKEVFDYIEDIYGRYMIVADIENGTDMRYGIVRIK